MKLQKSQILTRIPKGLQWIERKPTPPEVPPPVEPVKTEVVQQLQEPIKETPQEKIKKIVDEIAPEPPVAAAPAVITPQEEIKEPQPEQHAQTPTASVKPATSVTEDAIKSSERGLGKGLTRATFIIKYDYLETLKAMAYWDKSSLKDILNEALEMYFKTKDLKEYLKHKRKKH